MKKFFNRFVLFLTLICLLSSTLFGCDILDGLINNYSDSFIDTDGKTKFIVTDVDEVNLLLDTERQISAAVVLPDGTTDEARTGELQWVSENQAVATVNGGLITAVSVGKTRVFVKISDNTKKKIDVSVYKKELKSIEILNPRTTFVVGSEFEARFTCQAVFDGGITETVSDDDENLRVDYSGVNISLVGDYEVNVSYTYKEITVSNSYTVSVVEAESAFKTKYLSYDYSDLYKNSIYSNIKSAYCPSSGTVNYLVIPVCFTDTGSYLNSVSKNRNDARQDINKAFFGEAKTNGWNSVKSFYETASGGKLSLLGTVADWYEPNRPASYYATDDAAVLSLAKSAVDNYFAENTSENRADYDSDGNGTLDCVAIIYGCPDSSGSEDSNFWGKVIRANTEDTHRPALEYFMWASFNDVYTDVKYNYFEQRNEVDSHVYIHETGHMFGLNDYYDYGEERFMPAGDFSTMVYNVGGQDPFSCLALGWAEAIIPSAPCTIELKDFQSDGKVIVLSANSAAFDSPFDEYIIIELYSPTGLNKFDATYKWRGVTSGYSQGASAAGIRLWHVDARLIKGTVVNHSVSWAANPLYTNPTVGNVETAFTNTWNKAGRISDLGEEYQDYSLLFFIRNDKNTTFKPTDGDGLTNGSLFRSGDSFTIAEYSSQFPNGERLDSGAAFDWKVEVKSVYGSGQSGYTASIELSFLN